MHKFALATLMQKQDPDLFKQVKIEIQTAQLDIEPESNTIQGAQVLVKPIKDVGPCLNLTWSDGQDIHHMTTLRLPNGTAPLIPNEKRFINFVEEGINIVDADGAVLGLIERRTCTVSLFTIFASLPTDSILEPFVQLWENVTGIHGAVRLFGGASATSRQGTQVYLKSSFKGSGRAWTSYKGTHGPQNAASVRASFPLQIEDSA